MMKKFILMIMVMAGLAPFLYAQSPVERLVVKYADVKGAKDLVAKGTKMDLARPLIRKTSLAPIADNVDELAVLRLQNASEQDKARFQKELNAALKSYQYYGKHDSKNGKVDVYVEVPENGYVRELVVYNPAIYTLNSLHGRFTVKSLLELSKEKN
jgi:hypothetical protein